MIRTGLDVFVDDAARYTHRSIGLIVNHTSVTAGLEYSWSVLRGMGLRIRRIFSPEHGLFGAEQDHAAVTEQPFIDDEVVSLYGTSVESLIPDPSYLEGLDLILFDIQDVGSRVYTYANTLALFMESVQGREIEIFILDRPNPLGGIEVEGPLPAEGFESFVCIYPVPMRHGLTVGELALLYREVEGLDVNLSIVKMEGWRRRMFYQETGLPWVAPSPNIPTWQTALVYPGICLLEGLNVSEGRGTTTPFQVFGAPFIEPGRLADRLNQMDLEGVRFRPLCFRPAFHKYANELLGGNFIHVTQPGRFRPFETGLAIVKALFEIYPEPMEFLHDCYEFNSAHPAFDLILGSSLVREMIQKPCDLEILRNSWNKELRSYCHTKENFHLYD